MNPPRLQQEAPALSDTSALGSRFEQLGWCPHQFHPLQQICSHVTLSYLSTLDRRNYRSNDHHKCKDNPCCATNSVHADVYNAAHTQTCSGSCLPLHVNYNEVVNIVRDGGFPIISIHRHVEPTSDKPILKLRVISRTLSTRYTAISHVWFDELGNPYANALPTCQVQRLYIQLVALPP